MGQNEFLVCRDAQDVSRKGAELLSKEAKRAANAGKRLSVALSGGSTPKTMFELLASEDFRHEIPWDQVDLFWGDERCVPPDHKDSNYRMTRLALLDHLPIPKENVYRIPAENEDPAAAAREYEQVLKKYFKLEAGGLPRFDLVYLGMGDDGHTASLFPETSALSEKKRLVTENFVKKFDTYRITLTVPVLNNGRMVAFLLAGEEKAARLKEVIEGPREPQRLPSQLIDPAEGRLIFILDEAAAAQLSNAGSRKS